MKKILIVEDETLLRALFKAQLERGGFVVLEAENGQSGLESALKNHPDLILLDIIMPIMDGLMMLEKLRQDQWWMNVPVILLTNLSDSAAMQKARQHNVPDYLLKVDWKMEEVVKKINEKLKAP